MIGITSVTSIEKQFFDGCESLVHVSIPPSVPSIEGYALIKETIEEPFHAAFVTMRLCVKNVKVVLKITMPMMQKQF